MSEKLNFAIDGEFLTNIARDWFWNMNKSYKKCEELLLSCMAGGSEEEKRHVCQDIIEGRKKLVGINEFELVDDNGKVRPLGQKVDELRANTKWLRGAPISLTLFQHVYVDGLEDITQAEMMPLTLTL